MDENYVNRNAGNHAGDESRKGRKRRRCSELRKGGCNRGELAPAARCETSLAEPRRPEVAREL
jgi:hypothetical protein